MMMLTLPSREQLESVGFVCDANVCRVCEHEGADHDIRNRCLLCSCDSFTSMTAEERWAYALAALAALMNEATP